MDQIVKALLLGMAAGILNGIPFALQGASWQVSIAMFMHWLALGVIIAFIRMPLTAWQSGLIVALLSGVPLMIIATSGMTAMLMFIVSSAVLGSLLGLSTEKLIRANQ